MKISSSQATLFNNKQLPIQSIPNGITLHQRSMSNNQLDFTQQAHVRVNQNFNGQPQAFKQQNSNVFPHQKIQPILKNSNVVVTNQNNQLASKSARCSPQRVLASQRAINNNNTSNNQRLNRTPQPNQQQLQSQLDTPQQQYQSFLMNQVQHQVSNNSINMNSMLNNSINQNQNLTFIKQLGGQQQSQYNSLSREQINQQIQQQLQNTQQYLHRGVGSGAQSYFNQVLSERDTNVLNKNIINHQQSFQAQDTQSFLQQTQFQKAQQVSQLQFQTIVQNQMPAEILTPYTKNQIQNVEELEEKRFPFNIKKDENEMIASPKIPKQFVFGKIQQQQQQQQRPQIQQLNLQNITNNITQIQKNPSYVPKSRAVSSISFKNGGTENQENCAYKEYIDNSNENANTNLVKKGNIQLQTYQTNKTLGPNAEILNSQIQLDQLIREAKQQQPFADQNLLFESNQNENQLNYPNNRFESFQINESLNMFQVPQFTINNNNITSQFNNLQIEQQVANQNYLQSLLNSEQNGQEPKQNTNQIYQSIHMNEQKPNNNLKLLQFQQHQQKLSQSPESIIESNIEGEQTQRMQEFQNEKVKSQQSIKINKEESSNAVQNNSKDDHQFSLQELRNESYTNQVSERDQYKQKFLQLQEENDRLSGLIKNLQIQQDEQTKQKQNTESLLLNIELEVQELQKNNSQLLKEKEQNENQIKELNQMLEYQNESENRYFLLEEKCSFYEQELSLLKQQEKDKSLILEKVKDSIQKANSYETEPQNIQQLEEYISEKIIILLERQKYQIYKIEQQEAELKQKIQDSIESSQQIQNLQERLQEYELSLQNLQHEIEEKYKTEYNNYCLMQQEQEVLANSKINQLSQELIRIKQEFQTTQEAQISEINTLNEQVEDYKQQLQKTYSLNQVDQSNEQSQVKVKQLEQVAENLEKQNQDLICINNMYLQQITELKGEHQICYTLKTENETLKMQLDNYQFQIRDRESEIRQLILKLEIKQNELNQAQKCYDYETKQHQQEIDELKQKLESNKLAQNINLNQKSGQQETDFNISSSIQEDLNQRNELLSQENNQLRNKLMDLENENYQLKMEYQQGEENQQILQQEILNLRNYIEDQNQEYIQQQSQIINDQEESVELKGDYEEQQGLDQSGAKNLDSLMHVLSCQTIGTNYYQNNE